MTLRLSASARRRARYRPFLLAAWLACACDEPAAAAVDCACVVPDGVAADSASDETAAADAEAEVAPDVAPPLDASATTGALPTCDVPWFAIDADEPALVPPPLDVTLTAHSAEANLTPQCVWAMGPASVCVPGSAPGRVRKTGDGTCHVTCTLPNGLCGQAQLQATSQVVLYVVGGERTTFPPPPSAAADAARISRLRTGDGVWDLDVAWLPEYRIQPALAVTASHLYVVGGETGGDYTLAEFWDVFFPLCLEAVITPTQLKSEVGCRAVRRLDLRTGAWDSPFDWPHPRVDMGFRQIGTRLYLLGGLRAKTQTVPATPELVFVADLASQQVLSPQPAVPAAIDAANAKLKWPALRSARLAGLPLVFHAGKTWLVSQAGDVVAEKDLGWPCPEAQPQAVFRFPGVDDDVFVLPGPGGTAPTCQKCPQDKVLADGSKAPWCAPWRYRDKKWTLGKPMPYAPVVEAPDGVYALAPDATYKLAQPDGEWQPVAPPMPYARFGFAAAAVQQ